jgi:hypothetical protein
MTFTWISVLSEKWQKTDFTVFYVRNGIKNDIFAVISICVKSARNLCAVVRNARMDSHQLQGVHYYVPCKTTPNAYIYQS